MSDVDQYRSRRDEYAEATWQAVVTAARELFGQAGYSRTTVQQIARRARVSPATVYAQCGGKQGLLKTLMDSWTAGPLVRQIIDACASAPTAADKLRELADGYVAIYEASGDIIPIVTEAAASTPDAAAFLETANARHLDALQEIVAQLRTTGQLRGSSSFTSGSSSSSWGPRPSAGASTGPVTGSANGSRPPCSLPEPPTRAGGLPPSGRCARIRG